MADNCSGLMLAAVILATAALAPDARAQDGIDTDPARQSPREIADVFGVDVDDLPEGSVWRRVRGSAGTTDSLQLEIPARVTVTWSDPAPARVSCPVMLTMTRTGDQPGVETLPAGIQFVMIGGGGLSGGLAFNVVDGEARNGAFMTGAAAENYEPLNGPPSGVWSTSIVPPGPNCGSIMEMASNISGQDVLNRQEMQVDLSELQPEARARAEEALRALPTILGPGFAPGPGSANIEMVQQAACFTQAFPAIRVVDPDPTRFHVIFGGSVEGPDEDMCPVVTARGQIHIGPPLDFEDFAVISHAPEAVPLRGPGQTLVQCTNNDPDDPVLEVLLSDRIDRRSIAGNVRLMQLTDSGWEDTGHLFDTDSEGRLSLEAGTVLEPLSLYRVEIDGGTGGLRGRGDDQFLEASYSFEFQTAPASTSEALQAMFGEAVDFHVYQGSRDAPLVPERPAVTRTQLDWPPEDMADAMSRMPRELCMRVETYSDVTPAGRVQPRFDPVDFPFPRQDLVVGETRRLGNYRALNTGYTPERGREVSFAMSARLTLFNFTSASGADAPEVVHERDEPTRIAANTVHLMVDLYTLHFASGADVSSPNLPLARFRTLADDGLDRPAMLNAAADRFTGIIERGWADIDNAAQRFLPLNRVRLNRAGVVEMDDFGDLGDISLPGLTALIENYFQREVLVHCYGRTLCGGVIPIDYKGARAFTDNLRLRRGFLIGLDSIDYIERNPPVITHEIGHTFGLAHAPNDYNRSPEQDRIRDEFNAYNRSIPLLWPGVDQVMIWPDGTVGYRHSEDGSSQHREIWPLMYNSALRPLEGGMPMDQYAQVFPALQNPHSRNPQFFGPYQAGAQSSYGSLESVLANLRRVRWSNVGFEDEGLPAFRNFEPAEDAGESGVLAGFVLTRTPNGFRTSGGPLLTSTAGLHQTDDAGAGITVSLSASDDRVIASATIARPAMEAGDEVWVDVFIPVSEADASRVGGIAVLDDGRILVRRDVEALPQLPAVNARMRGDRLMVDWGTGSTARVRVIWTAMSGGERLLYSGPDAGGIDVPAAGLARSMADATGVVTVERTNGIAALSARTVATVEVTPDADEAVPATPAPQWQAEDPRTGDTPRAGGSGGRALSGADRDSIISDFPELEGGEASGDEAGTDADPVDAVEEGYVLVPGDAPGEESYLVRIPDSPGCGLTRADIDELVRYQTDAMPAEVRAMMAEELRREYAEAIENPLYDQTALCGMLNSYRDGAL